MRLWSKTQHKPHFFEIQWLYTKGINRMDEDIQSCRYNSGKKKESL